MTTSLGQQVLLLGNGTSTLSRCFVMCLYNITDYITNYSLTARYLAVLVQLRECECECECDMIELLKFSY